MNKINIYRKLREETETNETPELTQTELADIFSSEGNPISQSVISKLEKSKKNPPTTSANVIKAYAEHFKVTADYLLGIRGNAVVDENIAMIGKTTGLNDTSIKTLKKVKNYWNPRIIDTLNFIMKDDSTFLDLIDWISIYIDNPYTIPITINPKTGTYEQCGYVVNGKTGISLGQKMIDNKGNPGYKQIGVGVDILESHAMLKIQEILMNWKNEKKKDGD